MSTQLFYDEETEPPGLIDFSRWKVGGVLRVTSQTRKFRYAATAHIHLLPFLREIPVASPCYPDEPSEA